MKAAIELIFYLAAMANSNEQIRSLTGVYLRQGTVTEKRLEMSQEAVRGDHPVETGLCVSYVLLPPMHCQLGGDEERRRGRQWRNWLILGGARVGREEKGARERPSLKGSVLASQPSHHFSALSCSDVSLCMVLPRPLFPLSSMFLTSSQLNTHWNRGEEVPH